MKMWLKVCLIAFSAFLLQGCILALIAAKVENNESNEAQRRQYKEFAKNKDLHQCGGCKNNGSGQLCINYICEYNNKIYKVCKVDPKTLNTLDGRPKEDGLKCLQRNGAY